MHRHVYEEAHEDFRDLVARVVKNEIEPHFASWEAQGSPPRDFYRRLGELGILGLSIPEEFGGSGQDDFRYSAVLTEESMRAAVGLGTVRVHMDIVLPYLLEYATQEQRQRWLPGVASGDLMLAIAMTEPGTGSDLAGIRTTARRDGDSYVLDGGKTFITGAVNADLVLVVARTSPPDPADRRSGLTLLAVEASSPGYTVGRRLEKIGLKAQDTAELSFDGVRVPVDHVIGDEGRAFEYLGSNLPQERLSIAVGSQAAAQGALAMTLDYVRQRQVFGRTLSDFQNTKFVLAQVATDVEAGQAMVDRALLAHVEDDLSPVDAAKVKLFASELQGRVVDQCLQLFGGYGYILEYPIARLYADARVTRIYGGTSEVMRSIISKSLGL